MSKYRFISRKESYRICEMIKEEMMEEFSISAEEAVGRMNDLWGGYKEPIDEDEYFLNYELPKDWAYIVYYGFDSRWWEKEKSELIPRPYPRSK